MPSKGKKQRKKIEAGKQEANALLDKGVSALQPFAAGGLNAFNQANAFLGLGTPEQKAAAEAQFKASPFFTGAANAFNSDAREIDASASNSGVLFSQSRQNAIAEAERNNFQNAFLQFLGLNQNQTGLGFQGAAGQANIFGQQGQNAFNAGLAKAGTVKGFAQKLSDAVSATNSIGQLAGVAGNVFQNPSSIFTSDRRLKSNLRATASHGPLTVYRWTWNDEAKALGLVGDEVGFIADEVEKIMPEAVTMKNGYQAVDYGMVAERLG